ncbi:arginine--tRNA ligase [Candidatus Kaiserbacteria bacterium]|nr:MAG: arginine--tRNA ligase [Candidatus Kaiserbacteria bacterium]
MDTTIEGIINELVSTALKTLTLEGEVVLEHPNDLSHGDFSCNVAMLLAKQMGKNSQELAEEIVGNIKPHKYIKKVEIAGPGFINFYLTDEFFIDTTNAILDQGEEWGRNETLAGKKIMVEYTDPNPFKELHIGHLVPNALGESLSRLCEWSGAEVRRVTFQGDVGMHVAKAIWGLQKNGFKAGDTILASDLGKAYATGATAYEEEGVAEEIKRLNKTIYQRDDDAINALYDSGKVASIVYFEEVYDILGSDFDHYFFESVTGPIGQEIVEAHIGSVFEESEGAVVFKGEKYDLHTRVFINKEGLPTYEAKDIGLIVAKKEWWPFDTAITVTGTEQTSYFKVVTKAAELLMPEVAGKIKLVSNGMLKLTEGKMSSRTGDVISAMSFIQDLRNDVIQKYLTTDAGDISKEAIEEMRKKRWGDDEKKIPERIAVAAIKYAILKNTAGKDIMFDPKKSLSLEGDTGPYLQYTYARTQSILSKAKERDIENNALAARSSFETTELERLLYRFPQAAKRAAHEYEPHYVANYLSELASVYNSWYAAEQVLDGSDSQGYKLALTKAVGTALKKGLWLLGIQALERM